MTRPHPDQPPSFLWQGLLILLPVAALAIVGLSAITRDRAAVQEDARRRAHEILAQMSEGLGHTAAGQLTRFDPLAQTWFDYNEASLAILSGGESRRSSDGVNLTDYEAGLKMWNSTFPNLKPEQVFPLQFSLKADGELDWPLGYEHAPQPPAWLSELSVEQAQAWSMLEQSEHDPSRAGDFDGLVARFVATTPSREAQTNAEFLRLRHNATSQGAAEAIADLHDFARRIGSARDQSGVPLSSLALAEALNHAAQGAANEQLWRWISDEVLNHPSAMTSQLLARIQTLTTTNAQLSAGVASLQKLWESEERLRNLAELIHDAGKVAGLATANLWVENDQGRWFCVLNPAERVTERTDASGHVIQTTNRVTEVRAYPKQVVDRAFAAAVRDSQIGVPDYFGLFGELEGEPLNLNSRDVSSPMQPPARADVLAEIVGALSQPATLLVENSKNGEPVKTTTEVDALPGKPRFAMRLALMNPDLLFAHQRQRQAIFAAIIGFSALAALIGFIAARRAFRRQLRLNELKSNFVSSVSHELRAPIASVRLMAESLEQGKVSDPSKRNEYFRFIGQECRRLSALVENVLDFSRIEQGRKQYDLEPTDLAALAEQTIKVMQTYATERQVQLQFVRQENSASQNGCHINADGRALQQALVNLIDNAIKHSPQGENVVVGLEMQNGASAGVLDGSSRACLSVEDHGAGIPSSEHEKIFERFYRSGSELRRQTQGVGIGLSIVKHIVEAHGGHVVVRSAPGHGSCFTIELPLRVEQKTNGE